MDVRQFDFNRFHDFAEEKNQTLARFLQEKQSRPMIMQTPDSLHYGPMSHNCQDSLAAQLDFLTDLTRMDTDLAYTYLEPWHGVGIYAAAYGCPTVLFPGEAAQVRHIINDLEELSDLKTPDIKNCAEMQQVLETIRYFKEQIGDEIPIAVTDTQSPNDTASLIVDSAEFLTACLAEPETIDPLLTDIANLICRFTEEQMELIGDAVVFPGHQMPSGGGWQGLALSDDNMSFVSPAVYEETFLPYNNIVSRCFGGLHLHSCGKIEHNLESMKKTEGLKSVECAGGFRTDPAPNEPALLAPAMKGTGLVLKTRCGWDEVERLKPLLDPDIRLIVQLITTGSVEERNLQYAKGKQGILDMMK